MTDFQGNNAAGFRSSNRDNSCLGHAREWLSYMISSKSQENQNTYQQLATRKGIPLVHESVESEVEALRILA